MPTVRTQSVTHTPITHGMHAAHTQAATHNIWHTHSTHTRCQLYTCTHKAPRVRARTATNQQIRTLSHQPNTPAV